MNAPYHYRPVATSLSPRFLTIIESPYAGEVEANLVYARQCIRHAIEHYQETPFASHLLYTQMFDDDIPAERAIGISLGLKYYNAARNVVAYIDLGISSGMDLGMDVARKLGIPIQFRSAHNNDPAAILSSLNRLPDGQPIPIHDTEKTQSSD